MCVLIFEYGITTVSWYAELALRRRVSMSAIGSVIVIASSKPFSPWFPVRPTAKWLLPGRLRHAGQLAGMRHLADTDATQTEDAVDRTGPAASGAAGVAAHLELRLAPGFGDHRLGCHASGLLEGETESAQERTTLVVGGRGGHDGDVHAALPVDRVRV